MFVGITEFKNKRMYFGTLKSYIVFGIYLFTVLR